MILDKDKIILLTGGAGYIGSHMAKLLTKKGYRVITLDDLSTGHKEAVKYGDLVIGDIADSELLDNIFKHNRVAAVMHFAASSIVGESVSNPSKYYNNNVVKTLSFLDSMIKNKVNNLIFSSSAAIFGEPDYLPIDEEHPKRPINPYGSSKLMIEQILEDFSSSYELNSISLRYFNACGADPDSEIGEMHKPETHLIPLLLQVASGRKEFIKIYGTNFDTNDGTCIRDYIHVMDICEAHFMSLQLLLGGYISGANGFNLGNSKGFSVREVVDTAKGIVIKDKKYIKEKLTNRRPGDPAILIADGRKAQNILSWTPKYSELTVMINDAWKWELANTSSGY